LLQKLSPEQQCGHEVTVVSTTGRFRRKIPPRLPDLGPTPAQQVPGEAAVGRHEAQRDEHVAKDVDDGEKQSGLSETRSGKIGIGKLFEGEHSDVDNWKED
jgi:hypothetical protein